VNQSLVHVVAGAGPVGAGLALQLAELGHTVKLVTRSGTALGHPRITAVKGDVGNADWFADVCVGAASVVNAINPPYGSWAKDWPPVHQSLMNAAQRAGAVLVSMENLYGYGRPAHPGGVMRDGDALRPCSEKGRVRAEMSEEIFAAVAKGSLQAVSIRASDFYGPGVTDATMGERGIKQLLGGKAVQVIGRTDVPHTVSYMPDVVRAMTIAVTDERSWGRSWHAPSADALTQHQMWHLLGTAAGVQRVKLQALHGLPRRAVGLVMPIVRQIEEVAYQFDEPWVMDSTPFTEKFGLHATQFATGARETMEWWTERIKQAA
jgi:nucleoside-diphosphate-sugar epimerase